MLVLHYLVKNLSYITDDAAVARRPNYTVIISTVTMSDWPVFPVGLYNAAVLELNQSI